MVEQSEIISFKDDYSEGGHPAILESLLRHNHGQEEGYGLDRYCREAAQCIRSQLDQPAADIHFVSGGTQANVLVIRSILKPYESVIAASSGHINVHETGAIEAVGHKINLVSSPDGKLNPHSVDSVLKKHVDEHMVLPRLLYISQSTEYGSLYSKDELRELSRYCRENELFLYMDGARLAVALTADDNDLSLSEIAGLVDAFYIGGTKNGALLGEAIVLVNPAIQRNFRFVMKQSGALLAKGRILGIQFAELFRDDLFFKLGQHANIRARQLAGGIRDAGFDFKTPPVTNQIFPILPDKLIEHLRKQFDFYEWETLEGDRSVIRLVTSWATQESAIEELIIEINGPNNVS